MLSTPNNYFLRKPRYLDNPHGWIAHIPFAFYLAETMQPSVIVELGTYSGNSYFAFCQAVRDLQLPTRCYAADSWQGDIHVGNYGREVFERVSAINEKEFSSFSSLLPMQFDEALTHFTNESIDILHIDGTHTYDAVRNDFFGWLPKVKRGGIILLHDTRVRRKGFGVWRFLNEIREDFLLFEFPFSEGLAVICKDEHAPAVITGFINRAKEDAVLVHVFEALGNNILLEREKSLFRKEVLLMRRKTADLNKQLMVIKKENKELKKRR